MKAYLAILSSHYRMLLQYRAAAIAGVGTQLFFGFVRVMIFDAFYRSSTAPQPMTIAEVVTYIWLGQAFLLLTILDADKEVTAMIRTGAVAYELTRPLDLYSLWFTRALSGRAAPLSMRAIPIFVLAGAFFGLQAPSSVTAFTLFLVSLVGALLLGASIITLITISMLWTISGEGVNRLAAPMIYFLSGLLIPLPLFPVWAQQIISVLPFRGLIDTPFRIYMGNLAGPDALLALVHQYSWGVVFILAGRFALSRGLNRLVVQGG